MNALFHFEISRKAGHNSGEKPVNSERYSNSSTDKCVYRNIADAYDDIPKSSVRHCLFTQSLVGLASNYWDRFFFRMRANHLVLDHVLSLRDALSKIPKVLTQISLRNSVTLVPSPWPLNLPIWYYCICVCHSFSVSDGNCHTLSHLRSLLQISASGTSPAMKNK